METVSDALKALKRASSQVVAARLGISRTVETEAPR